MGKFAVKNGEIHHYSLNFPSTMGKGKKIIITRKLSIEFTASTIGESPNWSWSFLAEKRKSILVIGNL